MILSYHLHRRLACSNWPYQAWKGFEWATLDRLHEKGLIDDPKNKNTSVGLTDEGVAEAAAAVQRLFGVEAGDG